MSGKPYWLTHYSVTFSGTGNVPDGTAVPGCLTLTEAADDSIWDDNVGYRIWSDDGGQWEVGWGLVTEFGAGFVLVRETPLINHAEMSATGPVNFSLGAYNVALVALPANYVAVAPYDGAGTGIGLPKAQAGAIAIGENFSNLKSITIGHGANAYGENSVVIGAASDPFQTLGLNAGCVALGRAGETVVMKKSSVATSGSGALETIAGVPTLKCWTGESTSRVVWLEIEALGYSLADQAFLLLRGHVVLALSAAPTGGTPNPLTIVSSTFSTVASAGGADGSLSFAAHSTITGGLNITANNVTKCPEWRAVVRMRVF